MSVRVAVFSDDSVLSNRVLDGLRVDPACLAEGCAIPNVVVIDCKMAGAERLCSDLSAAHDTGVIMISVPEPGDAAVDALLAGARGIVYQAQPLADVGRAVAVVARGEVFAPRHVVFASMMKSRAQTAPPPAPDDPDIADRLSDREREVFRYAAVGMSNKELAGRLLISEATVKVHLTHIFQKLGLRGRGELAAAYYRILQ